MYHQIEGGPSIVCVNQSFAVGFLKTLGVPWTSALWRHLWFMIIPWLRGTTTFSNKQWHIISSYSSCFLGKSKQYWLSNPSQNVAIAVGSHGATIPAPGFFLIPVTQDKTMWSGWWLTYPSEKYESQLGWLFHIYIYIVENKNMFEPPTSDAMMQCPLFLYVCNSPAWKCKSLGMKKKVEWCWIFWYLVTLKCYMLIGDTDIWQLTSLSVTHAGDYQSHILAPQCGRHFPVQMAMSQNPGTLGTLK